MTATVRDHLRTHPPRFVRAKAVVDEPPRDVELADREFVHGLRCACGERRFRVLGVPSIMIGGQRGFVLRSVLRVWRELRIGGPDAAGGASQLSPPIALACLHCGEAIELVSSDEPDPPRPVEAHRCRPCRRSTFEAAIVCVYPDVDLEAPARFDEEERFDGWRLVVRCGVCGALSEPFVHGRRSEQERRIDRLYGREPKRGEGATP